jgi:hypothetical protein
LVEENRVPGEKTRWDFGNVVLSICNVLTSGYGGAQLPVLKVICNVLTSGYRGAQLPVLKVYVIS